MLNLQKCLANYTVSSLVAPYDMGNKRSNGIGHFIVLLQAPVGMHLVTSEVETV